MSHFEFTNTITSHPITIPVGHVLQIDKADLSTDGLFFVDIASVHLQIKQGDDIMAFIILSSNITAYDTGKVSRIKKEYRNLTDQSITLDLMVQSSDKVAIIDYSIRLTYDVLEMTSANKIENSLMNTVWSLNTVQGNPITNRLEFFKNLTYRATMANTIDRDLPISNLGTYKVTPLGDDAFNLSLQNTGEFEIVNTLHLLEANNTTLHLRRNAAQNYVHTKI